MRGVYIQFDNLAANPGSNCNDYVQHSYGDNLAWFNAPGLSFNHPNNNAKDTFLQTIIFGFSITDPRFTGEDAFIGMTMSDGTQLLSYIELFTNDDEKTPESLPLVPYENMYYLANKVSGHVNVN